MQERTIASKFPSAASAAKGNAASTPAVPAALRNARRSNRPANRSPQHAHAGACISDIVVLLDQSSPVLIRLTLPRADQSPQGTLGDKSAGETQPDLETGGGVFHVDVCSMESRNRGHQTEPQAVTLCPPAALEPGEAFEHVLTFMHGNSRSVVSHGGL